MAAVANRNVEIKNVRSKDVNAYRNFGWVRTNDKPENVKSGKKAPDVVIKRKISYSDNVDLANCEKRYFKLYKKKYRQKPILGILSFILMLAFLVVAVFELYFGISAIVADSKAVDTNAESEASEIKTAIKLLTADESDTQTPSTEDAEATKAGESGIKKILTDINDKYVAPIIDPLFRDTVVFIKDESIILTDEEDKKYVPKDTKIVIEETVGEETKTSEIVVNADSPVKTDSVTGQSYITIAGTAKLIDIATIAESIGMEKYLTVEIALGAVALILFIVFLIIFCEIAKIKKKRRIKFEKLADMEAEAQAIINYMCNRDPSLLSKSKRKEIMWTNIIANGIRQAQAYNSIRYDDEDDE
ncbi:MAG: hypothetical protein ACI4SK_03285 [Christensenellales bacterium]